MHFLKSLPAALAVLCTAAWAAPRRDIRQEALSAASATVPHLQICLPVGFTDEDSPIDDGFSMFAELQPDGSFVFDSARQAKFDALAAAGLLSLEATRMRRGTRETPIRLYRKTPLGAAHFRGPELGTSDEMAREPRVCYGQGQIVRVWEIDWTDHGGCGESLAASVLYTYRMIPEWADHPAIRATFPEWIGRAGAGAVRYQRLTFVGGRDGWIQDWIHHAYSTCIPNRRTRSLHFAE